MWNGVFAIPMLGYRCNTPAEGWVIGNLMLQGFVACIYGLGKTFPP